MNATIARSIAHSRHDDQRDRRGALLVEHVDRVAARVAADERAIAYLHDLLEWTDVSYETLRADGLTDHEAARRHIAMAQARRDERASQAVPYRAPERRHRPADHERLPASRSATG